MALQRRSRRGGNAIEFALTLPILIVMIAGVIDYSWYFSQHSAVVSAVRDGARRGSIANPAADASGDADVAVRQALDAAGLDGTGADVLALPVVLGNGDNGVQVTATLDFTPIVDFPLLATPASLTYTLTMRLEN